MTKTVKLCLTVDEFKAAMHEYCVNLTGLVSDDMKLINTSVNGADLVNFSPTFEYVEVEFMVEVEFTDDATANRQSPKKK